MTGEELDQARAAGKRLWCVCDIRHDVASIAAQLAREGWAPPKPVDPDVLVVREVLAAYWLDNGAYPAAFRRGSEDGEVDFQAALAAFRAEKKRQQGAGE